MLSDLRFAQAAEMPHVNEGPLMPLSGKDPTPSNVVSIRSRGVAMRTR